ncbi:MAG TPA: hypothetical protein VKU41_09560 [Polyangiaceae bacterium]|nr:hypothetical protein [Polyangiaceae bacterium]
MKTRQAFSRVLAISACASIASSSLQAQARTCSAASDCPKGFDCQPAGMGPDGGPANACVSLSCQSNADCGPGLSCYADMGTRCQTSEDGGQTCGPYNACVPQWEAPCVADPDCGPGYTCPPSTFGSYNCGKDQDASLPSYATVSTVPCSAVPKPPFLPPPDSGFVIPSICEAGTTCTKVTWNTCVAQNTGACRVDSDCPQTWTCACQSTCGALPPGSGIDAGCTLGCIPPNSDLSTVTCNGVAGGPSFGPSTPTTPPSSALADGGVDAAASHESPEASASGESPGTGSSSAHGGGCQIAAEGGAQGWPLLAAGALLAARSTRRTRRPRKPARSMP